MTASRFCALLGAMAMSTASVAWAAPAAPPREKRAAGPGAAGEAAPGPRDRASPGVDATMPPREGSTPKEMTPRGRNKSLSHRLQVSVDLSLALGAAFRVTYSDTVWCGQGDPLSENDTFCVGLAPPALDIGIGFGVLDALELLAEFRVGMMNDTLGNRPLVLMPGLRIWIDPTLPFKIGLALQLVLDFTRQDSATQQGHLPEKGTKLDLGVRFFVQVQYDFLRYVGIFARMGLLGTFQKWVGVNLEGSLGVQTRFP